MDPIIEFKDVTYAYPLTQKPAVENLSFKLEKGQVYGVIGPNGSGKTTLCALIRGFAPSFYLGQFSGEVLIDGRSTLDQTSGELALRVGYVFQNPFNQISGVKETVFEEIAFGLENFGVPVDEIIRRVEQVMELTNVTELAYKNPFRLSGGQQQRVALASILVLDPDIMVIDEPTSQLDPDGTENVFRIIHALRQRQKTIILVEHKVDLIAEYVDNVLVMKDGKLLRFGPAQTILSDESLLSQGVQLPQMALLGNRLRRRGLPLEEIPITEAMMVQALERCLHKEGGAPHGNAGIA